MISSLLVLGIYGDLAGRYLLPAVARLHAAGKLGDDVRIVGVGRRDSSDEALQEHVRSELREHGHDLPEDAVAAVAGRAHYVQGSADDPQILQAALDAGGGPAVIYLALPNTLFAGVLVALRDVALPAGSRVVVEKPFGDSLQDARHLNTLVHDVVHEDAVFRVDHFLAKQTVLNILGVRFANRLFEPVWNAAHVEGVDIVWEETLGLEGRAAYYDGAGALVDMVQNHLLQLMALLAMEPPPSMSAQDLRDRKVDLLRSVRTLSPEEVRDGTVRARYAEGSVGGRELPSYAESEGVDPARETETYAEVTLYVDNWRWAGVPFRLRSGKALAADRAEVVVRFKPVPHQSFDPGAARPNTMRFSFSPDTIGLGINVNGIGDPFRLDATELTVGIPGQELPPYALLMVEVLEGDPTLSIRGDEAEECWRIVEPVLAGWRSGDVPLREYPAGSDGPPRPAGD